MARKINVRYNVEEGENIEKAISKFNEMVNNDGIIKKHNDKKYYIKPSEKRHHKNQRRKREIFIERLKTHKKRKNNAI